MAVHTEAYLAHLQSAKWAELRAAALAAAGHRCQHREEMPPYELDPPRCENVSPGLHVHHVTYDRVGDEQPGDLMVLCPQHHAAYELLKIRCARCEEPVFNEIWDALEHWEFYDDDVARAWADKLHDARADAPRFCCYCQHVLTKPD